MPWFHSEDPALTGYNGRKIAVLDEWRESCDGDVTEVMEVLFEDGTVITCWPSEVRETHPSAEQYRCKECGNLWLYTSDHKPECSGHPNIYMHLSGPSLN